MKTNSKSIIVLSLVTAFLLLSSINSNAQCSFKIVNALGCSAKVDIVIKGTPPAACTFVCNNSQTGITIGGGATTYNILCTGCGTICNIEVTVTHLNGLPLGTTVMKDFTNGAQSFLSNTGAPCNAIGSGFTYDPGSQTFKID